jgi:GNAT superfamily N-acetyltransferase
MSDLPEIRAASPRDRNRIVSLWLDLVEHHRRLDPAYPSLSGIREVLLEEVERGIRSRRCRVLVADPGDKPIAFLFAELQRRGPALDRGRSGRIQELYVDPAWRSRGVGRALVDVASGWLRERGARSVSVRVEPGNHSGFAFWQRSGFVERARILERKS